MHGAGEVQIADDVIAVIAEIAALEVDGVFAIAGGKNDIVQTIRGKKGAKGIKVEILEDEVQVDLALNVKYGIKIQDTCIKVQEKVKNSIETMTGLNVQSVDVHVVGVDFSKTNPGEEH
nr:Asp23/Gls24 family envelope stress response protein [uncultured Niameybacter sp.]